MRLFHFWASIGCALLGSVVSVNAGQPGSGLLADSRPNIVVVLADDFDPALTVNLKDFQNCARNAFGPVRAGIHPAPQGAGATTS